jgi:hypothetical protein
VENQRRKDLSEREEIEEHSDGKGADTMRERETNA